MSVLALRFDKACGRKSDINEHLRTLHGLARECDHVTEMGTRGGISSLALLYAQPATLILIDKAHQREAIRQLTEMAKDETRTKLEVVDGDTCDMSIEETDLLFIDTYHTYTQLKKELALHAEKAKKWLIFHDTVTFGEKGEDNKTPGLMKAINEFLEATEEWKLHHHYENNNGLLVLKRVSVKKKPAPKAPKSKNNANKGTRAKTSKAK